MRKTRRLSPMTTYYLRKLIQAKQTQLSWKNPNLNHTVSLDSILMQISDTNPESTISLELLDRLVKLHQTLATTQDANGPQVLDLESKIYDSLDIKWTKLNETKMEISSTSNELYLNRCRNLLKELNKLKQRSEAMVGMKITLAYLLESRPNDDWCENFQVSETGSISYVGNMRELITNTRLKTYEQWMQTFIQKCESIVPDFSQDNPTQAEPLSKEERLLGAEPLLAEPKAKSVFDDPWIDFRKELKLLQLPSNETSPKRCRDLLKQLKKMQQKSTDLIGVEVVLAFLRESRPNHGWCQMFKISKEGSISYHGNMRELITNSRIKVYEQWLNTFIQMCESYYLKSKQEENSNVLAMSN